MSISQEVWGTYHGEKVMLHTLTNYNGGVVKLCSLGSTTVSILVPDRKGNVLDVVLGFDQIEGYAGDHPYFGSTVGRFANRISGANFSLHGHNYSLVQNVGVNTLHGGNVNFSRKNWKVVEVDEDHLSITHELISPHMDEGFPGELRVLVRYQWTNDHALNIDYFAWTDAPTVINLTDHSYFNLAGRPESILGHICQINADFFTPVNDQQIPTGEIHKVIDTPLDFTYAKTLGRDIESDNPQLEIGNGYDHNYVLRSRLITDVAAEVYEPISGRRLRVFTTEPGVQLYTGNFLQGIIGKNKHQYEDRSGFCLETQHFPDSPNISHFPGVELLPGDEFTSRTIYKFDAKG